jgi:hypothetical protein
MAAALQVPVSSLLMDALVLAEVRIALERVRQGSWPAARDVAERIVANVENLLLAEAGRAPTSFAELEHRGPVGGQEQLVEVLCGRCER